ncbi:type II toxin-antitoxin system RelE/ParE family toxin [Fructilactobacillus sp. Tb1]|uniref:type II toxin-antitoxin system RelE/ParE family toxin n=1 Tax=Fructilactobacillus sp. Tb1 TaxID=3422304 RepID=UPI003D2CE0FC
MMQIETTPGFDRDLKKCKKKHWDLSKLKRAVNVIASRDLKGLEKLKNHKLKGNWNGYEELHIEKDWLLIYQIDDEKVILTLTRTGRHQKLLDK